MNSALMLLLWASPCSCEQYIIPDKRNLRKRHANFPIKLILSLAKSTRELTLENRSTIFLNFEVTNGI